MTMELSIIDDNGIEETVKPMDILYEGPVTQYDSISFDCEFTPRNDLPDILSNETPTNFRMTVNKPGILGFIYRLFKSKKGTEIYSFVGLISNVKVDETNDETTVGCSIDVIEGTLSKETNKSPIKAYPVHEENGKIIHGEPVELKHGEISIH